jgi:hypothetical protein
MIVVDQGPFPLSFGLGPFGLVEYPSLIGWYWFLAAYSLPRSPLPRSAAT